MSIGERRRPEPNGRPGYLRVDTVGTTVQISETYLLPVLEAMLAQFPFRILGFHSDNGSEFINCSHSIFGTGEGDD